MHYALIVAALPVCLLGFVARLDEATRLLFDRRAGLVGSYPTRNGGSQRNDSTG